MDAPLVDAKINSYKQKVEKLDSIARNLSSEQLSEYQAAKRRYQHRLKAWQRTLDSDLAAFNTNVLEGYEELEAHLLAAKNRQL